MLMLEPYKVIAGAGGTSINAVYLLLVKDSEVFMTCTENKFLPYGTYSSVFEEDMASF